MHLYLDTKLQTARKEYSKILICDDEKAREAFCERLTLFCEVYNQEFKPHDFPYFNRST